MQGVAGQVRREELPREEDQVVLDPLRQHAATRLVRGSPEAADPGTKEAEVPPAVRIFFSRQFFTSRSCDLETGSAIFRTVSIFSYLIFNIPPSRYLFFLSLLVICYLLSLVDGILFSRQKFMIEIRYETRKGVNVVMIINLFC
jgi:hypothetical protein